MEQTSFFECSGLAPQRSLKEIYDEVQLDVPAAISYVADELVAFFSGSAGHHLVAAMVASINLRLEIEDRVRSMYTTSESFRKECKRAQAKSYLIGFVRKWAADAMKTRYPELHVQLPASFRAAGMPIPRNMRVS